MKRARGPKLCWRHWHWTYAEENLRQLDPLALLIFIQLTQEVSK